MYNVCNCSHITTVNGVNSNNVSDVCARFPGWNPVCRLLHWYHISEKVLTVVWSILMPCMRVYVNYMIDVFPKQKYTDVYQKDRGSKYGIYDNYIYDIYAAGNSSILYVSCKKISMDRITGCQLYFLFMGKLEICCFSFIYYIYSLFCSTYYV